MFTFLIDGSLAVSAAAWLCVACAVAPDVREWVSRKLDRAPHTNDVADRIAAVRHELGLS